MSLIRPIIRMCARAALLNKTWAEDRVFDSMNTPLADMLTADAAPYISIYTDEDTIPEISGKDFYLEPRTLSLTLELGCAKAVEIPGTSPAEVKVEIPESDEGLELIVDIVQTQMLAALLGDPTNEWAELLRKILFHINRIPSQRGGSAQAGTRFAARQVTLVCDTIADTPPGVVPGEDHPIRQFIALAKATAGMENAGTLIDKVVNKTAAPDWRQIQAWMTLTREGIAAIGLAPLYDEETAAELGQVELTVTPKAPILFASSPTVNPPVFDIGLIGGYADERDAKVGDIVQVEVSGSDIYVEVYSSPALSAENVASGMISITGKILPDGQHKARARMMRPPAAVTIEAPTSEWSDPVSFVITS